MGVFAHRLRRNLIGPIALHWKVKIKKNKKNTNKQTTTYLIC